MGIASNEIRHVTCCKRITCVGGYGNISRKGAIVASCLVPINTKVGYGALTSQVLSPLLESALSS